MAAERLPEAVTASRPGVDPVAPKRPTMPEKQKIKKWSNGTFIAMGSGTLFALLVSYATDPGRFLNGLIWPSLALLVVGDVIAETVA